MKKIISIVCAVLVIVALLAIANEHVVVCKWTNHYNTNQINWMNVLMRRRTTVEFERIETKLITGEVVEHRIGSGEVEVTAEMWALLRNCQTQSGTTFDFR